MHDLIQGLGYKVIVASPSAEAWCWKNIKSKTDKDDVLKLAKLAALKQISSVHVPNAQYQFSKYQLHIKHPLANPIGSETSPLPLTDDCPLANRLLELRDQLKVHPS